MENQVNPVDVVTGHKELTDLFGDWPSFHDAEVLDLRLHRRGPDEWESPILEADIHLFKGRRNQSVPPGIEWYDHTVVTMRFTLVVGLELYDFNHQNAIFDFILERPPDAPSVAPNKVTF